MPLEKSFLSACWDKMRQLREYGGLKGRGLKDQGLRGSRINRDATEILFLRLKLRLRLYLPRRFRGPFTISISFIETKYSYRGGTFEVFGKKFLFEKSFPRAWHEAQIIFDKKVQGNI